MPAPIGPDPSRFQQQATGAAHQRGDTGRAGRAATQSGPQAASGEETREPQVQREVVPSGLARESFPDGETRLHMPTGHVVIHRPGEEPWVSGPDGEQLPAQHDAENGIYGFLDTQGNQVLIQPGEMAFAVRNSEGTVSQQVHASGAQLIEAEVTFQQRGTGRTEQVVQRVVVDPEGNIRQENHLPGGSRVAPDGLEFGTKGMRLDLPYRIPQDLQGPDAAPAAEPGWGPEAAPSAAPPPPPMDAPPASPDVLFQPSPDMPPQAPPGMGGMPPGAMPPGMGPQAAAPSSDPFAPVNAPSGLIRQRTPEGSLHISLPNGVVLSMAPDGTAQGFDARANGPVPAAVRPRPRPDGRVELQYDFPDAQGNRYTMFSDSLDFAVTSADGRVRQVVLPQGNILTGVRGADGRSHRMEILPNGGVNTFGEGGVQMAADRVLFGGSQPPEMVPLPYPMPAFQGMIAAMRPLQPGAAPVSGLVPPEFAAAGGYTPTPPQAAAPGMGMPGMGMPGMGMPGMGMPGMGMPGMGMPGMGMPGMGMPGMGMPPGYPMSTPGQQGPAPGTPPPQVAPPAPGTTPPAAEGPPSLTPRPGQPQETVEPGLWQRVKNFFKGDDDGPRHRPTPGPYPGAYYQQQCSPFPYAGLAVASIGVTALTTAMLASSMFYPMGFAYNPMMMGGFGGWCF